MSSGIMNIPENRTLRGEVIDYTSDRTLPLNEAKIYFSPVQAGEGTPSPENVREISGWDSVTLNVNSRLPSEYQEVEYIESTGTQYIDLNFGFHPNDKIIAEFSIDITQNIDKYMVSPNVWNTNNNRFAMGVHNYGKYTAGYGYSATSGTMLTPLTINDGNIHKWIYNNRNFSIPELECSKDVSQITFVSETVNLRLFYGYNSNTKGKIKSYHHIKQDGTEINLIPCYRISDHIPGMFDLVSNQFYTNSGTGDFILGPEVGITIDFPKTIYGGYVDLIRGEIVETYGEYIFDGDQNISMRNNYSRNGFIAAGRVYLPFPVSTNASDLICDRLPYGNLDAGGVFPRYWLYDPNLTYGGIVIGEQTDYPDITTSAERINLCNEWLQNNPVTVVGKRKNPIIHPISPQDLRLLRGANKFSSNLNGDIEISFAAEEYPQLSGNIVTFNSPVAGKEFEECKVYFSPIQEGSGDSSPDNVRPISGWDGITLYLSGSDTSNPTTLTIPFNRTIYGGYVDLVRGEVVETDYLLAVDKDTTAYNVRSNAGHKIVGYYDLPFVGKKMPFLYYSHGAIVEASTATYNYQAAGTVANYPYNGNAIRAAIAATSDIASVSNYSGWLASVGTLQIVYKLLEPNTYTLTPETIKTLKGINNIWSNANGNITVRAIGNVPASTHSMDFVRRENISAPHIESKTGNYLTFRTDMEMPLTSGRVYFSPKQDLHGYDKPWIGGAGKNKLDPSTIMIGKTYGIDGTLGDDNSRSATEKIRVDASKQVYVTYTCSDSGARIIFLQWDSEGNLLSRVATIYDNPYVVTLDSNCYEIAVSFYANSNPYATTKWSNYMISQDTSIYEPYENICPIEGWDEIKVYRTGKNLVDIQDMKNTYPWTNTTYKGYSLFVGSNKTVTISHLTDIANGCDFYVNVGVKASQKGISNAPNSQWMYHKSSSSLRHKQITVTADNDGYIYINVYVVGKGLEQFYTLFLDDCFQIEYGDTATAWELFNSFDVFTIAFPKTIYGGYVDLVSGEVVETEQSINLKDVDWQYSSVQYRFYKGGYSQFQSAPNQSLPLPYVACSTYNPIVVWGAHVTKRDTNDQSIGFNSGNISVRDLRFDDNITGFKEYLASQNSIVVLRLVTPNTYSLTTQPITTLSGINNFWTTANGSAEISYYRHSDDSYQYINAQAIASNDNYLLVTDDGFVIGNEENVTIY